MTVKRKLSKYDEFVEHPRYGRYPRVTGLDPGRTAPGVCLHWNATNPDEIAKAYRELVGHEPGFQSQERRRIPGTAIVADTAKQQPATVQVTHYYDVERRCCDCRQPFIFFAQEQKHWYESLRFPLEADAIRCPLCRQRNQALARARSCYDRLVKLSSRTEAETGRLIAALLTLMENGVFNLRQTEHVRALLKTLPETTQLDFCARLERLEAGPRRARQA